MLGPTAQNLEDKTDSGSSEDGLKFLREKGRKIAPELLDEEITAIYAGLRASTEHSDFQIRAHQNKYITVGGIRSTGLTASMAIAEYVKDLLVKDGLILGAEKALPPITMPNLGETFKRPYQDESAIAANKSATCAAIPSTIARAISPLPWLRVNPAMLAVACGFHSGAP